MNEELPTYATEVRFYRGVLKVAYETGSRLRKLGVLTPDAVCEEVENISKWPSAIAAVIKSFINM